MDMVKYSIPANMAHLMGMAWKYYKLVFVLILVQMISGGIAPLLGLYLPVVAVDLVLAGREINQTLLLLGGFVGAMAVTQIIFAVSRRAKYPFQNHLRMIYLQLIFFKSLDCDYRLLETSDGQNWRQKATDVVNQGDGSATSQMFNAMASIISGGISFAFLIGILAVLNPIVLVGLVGLSAMGYVIDRVPLNYENKQRDYVSDLGKKSNYLEWTMGDIGAGKDMRLYNLPPLFARLTDEILAKTFAIRTKILSRYFAAETMQNILGLVRDGLAYAYCIWQVTQRNITVPEFILFMGAIASFSGWLKGLVGNVLTLKRENVRMNDLRGFLEATNTMNPANPTKISEIQKPVEIEFKNVSFRYTANTPFILDNISFQIKANEKIALVGVNGAGKTTIVKLLCGFYKADAGEILLNGINIDSFNREDLYTIFSAVFQDICIMPLTASENISFQRSEDNDADVIDALKSAGIYDDLMKYENGINTQMTKIISEDGIVLSGGQQQKLTLARALYKNAPVIILDEPTAALDPIAESEVYEKFHEMSGDKTALYISHRLASTRFCDRILMLSGGKIIENGSHDALMAQGGEYANMYEIQSHYYKDEVEANA